MAAAAGIIILAAAGTIDRRGRSPGKPDTEETQAAADIARSGTEPSFATEPETPSVITSAAEKVLLDALYTSMEEADYVRTARLINENQDRLTTLVNETLDRELYLYFRETSGELSDGEAGDTDSLKGEKRLERLEETEASYGLVVSRFNTVFFGNFTEGKPHGTCAAVQAMILEEPYFTFAVGQWEDGKMSGKGSCGYQYYVAVPKGRFHMTKKEGTFVRNLLDGPFTYTAENVEGESLCWSMEAREGVTVLDDSWIYYPSTKEYMKGSDEDEGRAYVLAEARAAAVLWSNLIIWDGS